MSICGEKKPRNGASFLNKYSKRAGEGMPVVEKNDQAA